MLWEVEIVNQDADLERRRVADEYDLLTHSGAGGDILARTSRGYLLQGSLDREQVHRLAEELLVDPVAEVGTLRPADANGAIHAENSVTVLLKPGVMDPVAMSLLQAAAQLGENFTYRRGAHAIIGHVN